MNKKKEEYIMAQKFHDDDFQTEVLDYKGIVLVDFFADWCGPCKMMSPIVDTLSEEYEGKIKVGKVNIDENMKLAQKYRVMTIPTIMLFQNGEVKETSIGAVSKEKLVDMIKPYL